MSKRLAKRVLRRFLGSAAQGRPPAPEYWGLSRTAAGDVSLDGVTLRQLAQEWGSPLHIVNARRLRENAGRFLAVPAGRRAGCEVYYSYKTNPIAGVLQELHALGVGAEVISHYELWLALQLGVPPERIVFNGPGKSDASIRQAIDAQIQLLNVNHREEIARVGRIAGELGRRPRIGIRITVGQGWAGQFGVPVAGGLALQAYEEALRVASLDVVGLHAHRGGMIRSRDDLTAFVLAVLSFVDELHRRTGRSLQVLDFGGSLATPTVRGLSTRELRLNRALQRELEPADPARALGIDEYVSVLTGLVEDFYDRRRWPRPRIVVEPGRAITGDAQMLLTSVLTVKSEPARTFLVLDAGINLAESCRSEYHALLPVTDAKRPGGGVYTVVGPICTPGDTLYWAARLPSLNAWDSLLIMDAGAYFVPFATSFSFPQPPIVMVDGEKVTLLRRGERFEDLAQRDLAAAKAAGAGTTPGADR